jgi:hypothetical protein
MIQFLAVLAAVAAAPTATSAPVQGNCVQLLQNGGFDLGASSWTPTSSNGTTHVCDPFCGTGGGTAGPRSGVWWAWLGGFPGPEEGSVSQPFTPPAGGTSRLRFHLRIGAQSGNGQDYFRALVSGEPVFEATESTPGFDGYTLVELDITAEAPPGSRTLRFEARTFGNQVTNFNVDDVSIQWCPLPTLSIGDPAPVPEGHSGSTPAAFNVSLSESVPHTVFVGWATAAPPAGHAAIAGSDYVAGSGTLTFTPGTVSVPRPVNVLGDALDEFDEAFAVVLSAPSGATIADGTGVATIVDDDAEPVLSIGDVAVSESGVALFPLTMTPASGRPVVIQFSTTNVTATAGTDYAATAGSVTLPPGSLPSSVSVPILADALDELDETFIATVDADFASTPDAEGEATIDDDDGPGVRIADVTVAELNAGSTTASFAVSLTATSVQPVTMAFTTADGTAEAGADYTPASGILTFPAGTMAATVDVDVLGDVFDEPNETFAVVLSDVVDATAQDASATGFVVDDDGGAIQLTGELSHGTQRTAALAPATAPRDVYLLARPTRSSWEVVVDAASGDLHAGTGPSLARLAPDLSTVLQGSTAAGTGQVRRLAIVNALATPVTDYVAVQSVGCSTNCGSDDVYRVTARETTLAATRFNNTGGQSTIVILLDRSDAAVSGTIWFWSPGGALLGSHPFALDPRQSLVLNTTTVPGVDAQGGTITVTHDGPYGGLAGKAVALDATAGFSFDTPLEPRRR